MIATLSSLREKVRKAIDDIAPNAVDDFGTDANAEIDQALLHAAISLSRSLPLELIVPTITSTQTTGNREEDGSGYVELPSDYLRFVSLTVNGWKGSVEELMERGSEAEKMQRSIWSRGSATKPKAMLDATISAPTIKEVIRFWPSTTTNTATLVYIKTASESSGSLVCAIRDECEKNIIYLACSLFMEGKKENVLAEAFAKLAEL